MMYTALFLLGPAISGVIDSIYYVLSILSFT